MRIVRIALGVLIGLWGLWNLMPLLVAVGSRLHLIRPPANMAKIMPLFDAMAWWQLGLWAATVLLLLAAAWRLIRGGKAFGVYALAFVLDAIGWWFMQSGPGYAQIFSPAQRQMDYVIFAVLAAIGVAVWWLDGRRAAAVSAEA